MKGRILVNNWKEPIKQRTNKRPPKTFWEKLNSIINIILN